jgi:hypothetical protein
MKILATCFIILLLLVVIFRGYFTRIIGESLLPDENPQLVSSLQGSWALAEDHSHVFQIKRDSLVELFRDSIKDVKSLRYQFSGQASNYFAMDSTFDFSHGQKPTDDFKLIVTGKRTGDTAIQLLRYVSKSQIRMDVDGKLITLNRVD